MKYKMKDNICLTLCYVSTVRYGWGIKAGSHYCINNCEYFISQDKEKQIIECEKEIK